MLETLYTNEIQISIMNSNFRNESYYLLCNEMYISVMKFYFLRHQSDHTLNPLTYQCFRVHRHNTEAYRDLHCVYSVLITNGIPSCTPHRHPRERSSNR